MATDFGSICEIVVPPYTPKCVYTPYGYKDNGEWYAGAWPVDYLNKNYGQYDTAEDMKNASQSEAYDLFFDWLANNEKIPAT